MILTLYYLASDGESSMLQAINSDNMNTVQVVVVHNLYLFPHNWTGLTF